jgi:hypothetical protein
MAPITQEMLKHGGVRVRNEVFTVHLDKEHESYMGPYGSDDWNDYKERIFDGNEDAQIEALKDAFLTLINPIVSASSTKYSLFTMEHGGKGQEWHLHGYAEYSAQESSIRWTHGKHKIEGVFSLGARDYKAGSLGTLIAYMKKGQMAHEDWAVSKTEHPDYGKGLIVLHESGAQNVQGKSKDLTVAVNMLKEGANLKDIAELVPETAIRHWNGLEKMAYTLDKPRDEERALKVVWHFGPSGVGKTYTARRYARAESISLGQHGDFWFRTSFSGAWFQDYRGQKVVVLDEIRSSDWRLSQMLQLFQEYGASVPVKGSSVQFKPDVIHVTTFCHPDFFFENLAKKENGGVEQLERRITQVLYHKRNSQYKKGDDRSTMGIVLDITEYPWRSIDKNNYAPDSLESKDFDKDLNELFFQNNDKINYRGTAFGETSAQFDDGFDTTPAEFAGVYSKSQGKKRARD